MTKTEDAIKAREKQPVPEYEKPVKAPKAKKPEPEPEPVEELVEVE